MRSIPPFKLEIKFETGQEFLSKQAAVWVDSNRIYSSDIESYKKAIETGQWTKLYKAGKYSMEYRFNGGFDGINSVTLGEEHGVTWGSLGSSSNRIRRFSDPSMQPGALNLIEPAQHWTGGLEVTDVNQEARSITLRNGSSITSGLTSSSALREMERLESLREQQAAMNRHIAEHATHHRAELDRREAQRLAEQQRLEAERNRPSFLRRINPFR